MSTSNKPIKEKTFCSVLEAAEMLRITAEEVEAKLEAGTIESWPGADGRKLILRYSVLAMAGQDSRLEVIQPVSAGHLLAYVVDDSHEVLQHYRDEFKKLSCQVTLVQFDSVFDALLRIGKRKPQLLILDLRLLAVDWFPLIWSLWRNPELSGLKIVVGTEINENIIASRGALPPDVQVFQKPVPLAVLERIAAACAR